MSLRTRSLTVLTLALAATLGIAGCSSGGTSGGGEPQEGEAYGIAVGEEGEAQGIPGLADGTPVRVIEDVDYKPVAVPIEPERVVTLSEPTLDGTLRLGVKPVGSVNGRGQSGMPNYLREEAEGVPTVGTVAQFNFEAIAKLKPDLILTYASGGNNPESVAILEKIAPVVFVGYGGAEWKTTFRNVADALGKADEGEQVIEEFEGYAQEVGKQLDEAGYGDQTFSIVRWQGSNASLILKDLPPGMALEELGLKRPPAQDREGRGHSEPISLENLEDADADVMFFGTLGGSSVGNPDAGGSADISGAEKALAEAEGVPGFRQLKAYKNDRVILVDGSLWTSTGGLILMTGIVENIEQELLAS
ncbi:MAG: iron-siderophore ABC transporter substrate-binding protein [Leucobacter sp.]